MQNMARQTVLTVESYDDTATRQMLKSLYDHERFRDFEIHHCFIEGASTSEELHDTLERAIKEHKVSVLLIHTGAEFLRRVDIFSTVLQKLRSRFAELRIGIQDREKQTEKILRLISKDKNTRRLEKEFFAIKR